MLRWRLVLGLVLVAVLGCLCWCDLGAERPGVYLHPVALLLSIMAAGEFLWLLSARDFHPPRWAVYFGTVLTVVGAGLSIYWPGAEIDCPIGRVGWPAMGLTLGVLSALVASVLSYRAERPNTVHLALATFGMLYVGMLMSFIVLLRLLEVDPNHSGRPWGMVALLSMIAVVKASDVGAYTVGRLLGRHKMVPRLSPGKTWEGLAGGLLLGSLASYAVLSWLPPALGLEESGGGSWQWLLYGLILALSGAIGDLAESMIKRDAGQKDSSQWLPGFGGVLDILDSLLVAAPIAYLLWSVGMVGP